MVIPSRIITRPADSKDLPRLANLVHFEVFVHRHLDYRPPLDWIGHSPFLLLEKTPKIEAALACPPDPPSIAWIRLFASSVQIPVSTAWETLWSAAYAKLADDPNILFAAAIPLYAWLETLLLKSQFLKTHSIVMLSWENQSLPEAPAATSVSIRPMTLDDLLAVESIDGISFSMIWRNSLSYLEIAFHQAAVATVAEYEGRLVGYQISTATPIGGHLARLAVLPEVQGRGIGYALLYDLLKQFRRRSARTITVNTQKDNLASLSLYHKAGFQATGEEYPIYQLEFPSKG